MGRSYTRLKLFLIVLMIMALVTGLRGNSFGFLVTLLALVSIGIAYLWNRFVFHKLDVERTLSHTKVAWGKTLTYSLSVTNRKILPAFALRIKDQVPHGVDFREQKHVHFDRGVGMSYLRYQIGVGWYERRKRTYHFQAKQRGRFHFGPGSLEYSDPFGLFRNTSKEILAPTQLLVFPRIVPITRIATMDTFLFGSEQRDGWIFTDPLNRVGTRQYQSTDSVRHINWKASARHNNLQVDIQKPSFDQEVHIFLADQTKSSWWDSSALNHLEIAIMTVAALVERYWRAGHKISFYTNLASSVGPKAQGLNPQKDQRNALLSELAVLQSFSLRSSTEQFKLTFQRLPQHAKVIVVTPTGHLDPEMEKTLLYLKGKAQLVVVSVGPTETAMNLPGIKCFHIDGRAKWDELQTLELS